MQKIDQRKQRGKNAPSGKPAEWLKILCMYAYVMGTSHMCPCKRQENRPKPANSGALHTKTQSDVKVYIILRHKFFNKNIGSLAIFIPFSCW
jgi:hypothetical protein